MAATSGAVFWVYIAVVSIDCCHCALKLRSNFLDTSVLKCLGKEPRIKSENSMPLDLISSKTCVDTSIICVSASEISFVRDSFRVWKSVP